MPTRSLRLVAPLFVLLAACGGGSGDGEETSAEETTTTAAADETTTSTVGALDPDEIDAEASPFCATWADIRSMGGPPLTGDDEQDTQARRDHYREVLPVAERLQEEAPDEIRDAVDVAVESTRRLAETGDESEFSDPDVAEAQQALAAYVAESCRRS